MERDRSASMHRPNPPMPHIEPDPWVLDDDDLPTDLPDLPEPYRHPAGGPPVRVPPVPGAGVPMQCGGAR